MASLVLIVVASMGSIVSTKTCSNNMISPIDHVAMNHQNHTRTNGFDGHVRYILLYNGLIGLAYPLCSN